MAYRVAAAPNLGDQYYTIGTILYIMRNVQPPPASIPFAILRGPGSSVGLGVGAGAKVTFGEPPPLVRAVNLISCAAFCFVNATGDGYVYHANVGVISEPEISSALHAINAPPYDKVQVAVAHPGETTDTYQDSIARLVANGVPTGNIVEITDVLVINSFGLNNEFQIGY